MEGANEFYNNSWRLHYLTPNDEFAYVIWVGLTQSVDRTKLTSLKQGAILPTNNYQTWTATSALLGFLACWSTLQILDMSLHNHVG